MIYYLLNITFILLVGKLHRQYLHVISAKKFEEAMTPEEKAKLYRAIDYQENAAPQMYPKFFIEHIVTFRIHCLSAEVRDDSLLVPRVLSGELKGVAFRFEHRPSANAVK